MDYVPTGRRGGILRGLLMLLGLLTLAAGLIFVLAMRGAKLQDGLRQTGQRLLDKAASQAEEGPDRAGPSGRPPTAEPQAPPQEAGKPPAEAPPKYTVEKPPPVAKTWHRVAKGETLYGIAETYYEDGTLWKLIAEANGLKDQNDLKADMLLVIPGR
jgi:nucleoid-associated protein YgaU